MRSDNSEKIISNTKRKNKDPKFTFYSNLMHNTNTRSDIFMIFFLTKQRI